MIIAVFSSNHPCLQEVIYNWKKIDEEQVVISLQPKHATVDIDGIRHWQEYDIRRA